MQVFFFFWGGGTFYLSFLYAQLNLFQFFLEWSLATEFSASDTFVKKWADAQKFVFGKGPYLASNEKKKKQYPASGQKIEIAQVGTQKITATIKLKTKANIYNLK